MSETKNTMVPFVRLPDGIVQLTYADLKALDRAVNRYRSILERIANDERADPVSRERAMNVLNMSGGGDE